MSKDVYKQIKYNKKKTLKIEHIKMSVIHRISSGDFIHQQCSVTFIIDSINFTDIMLVKYVKAFKNKKNIWTCENAN